MNQIVLILGVPNNFVRLGLIEEYHELGQVNLETA